MRWGAQCHHHGEDSDCDAEDHNGTCVEEDTYHFSSKCVEDPFAYAAEVYGSTQFVVQEKYKTTGCQDLLETDAFPASGSCVTSGITGSFMFTVSLNETTGAVNITDYKGDTCSEKSFSSTVAASGKNVSTRDGTVCVNSIYKLYSSYSLDEDGSSSTSESEGSSSTSGGVSANVSDASYSTLRITSSSSSSSGSTSTAASGSPGISTGAIAGIVIAVIALALFALGFLWYRRRSKPNHNPESDKHQDGYASVTSPKKSTATTVTDFAASVGLGPQSLASLWDDEVIATSRIPEKSADSATDQPRSLR